MGGGAELRKADKLFDYSFATEDQSLEIPEGALGVVILEAPTLTGQKKLVVVWQRGGIEVRENSENPSPFLAFGIRDLHYTTIQELIGYLWVHYRGKIYNVRYKARTEDDQSESS